MEPHYRCGSCPRCPAGEYNICRHSGFAGRACRRRAARGAAGRDLSR
ncbi:alcohol dehydrogenase catalytic domain-containing protein [Streptomyces spongiae]|nr:alcohol dehydrogenase catalytic domain-containing protein [Streptomyces spongiae]